MNKTDFLELNILNPTDFDLDIFNEDTFLPVILVPLFVLIFSLCFSLNRTPEIKNKIEQELPEELSNDISENNETILDSSEQPYTSVLYESFLLMTKKQLLKMTGSKYKNLNKDELIIIALTNFLASSIQNCKLIPSESKIFIQENKDIMKKELYILYNIKSLKNEENEVEVDIEDDFPIII